MIFFTDLDGTLLDHETYSYDPAEEALQRLRANNIPIILSSSKTAAEIEPLRRELGFEHCEAIVENGAGLLIPGDQNLEANDKYLNLLEEIDDVPSEYRNKFEGFSQLSLERLSALSGLSPEEAKLAKERQFSEPGTWSGGSQELEVFCGFLEEVGIVVNRGGRFISLSFGGNKADRMREVVGRFRSGTEDRFCVALGDAPNDIAMLEAADLGIIVENPAHSGIGQLDGEQDGSIMRTEEPGPAGWNSAVLGVLDRARLGETIG